MKNQITRMQAALEEIPHLFNLMSEESASHKSSPARWSKKEILGHLIDSATYNMKRFIEAQFEPGPYIVQKYDQGQNVALSQYQQQATAELLNLWGALNRQIVGIMERQSPESLALPVQYETSVYTLEWLLADYVDHLEHHLRQIRTEVAAATASIPYHLPLNTAQERLREIAPNEFVTLLRRGTLEVELYIPDGVDKQSPHEKDELYVIISGTGTFVREEERYAFGPHDVLFVPAGQEHRFVDFTPDFKTWVVFYGPKGGE
ncbi:MAG: DinB family protein [Saprospiraceae bacterium]|nr:DinB family protein [Saprospiraceae bacterium]